MAGFSKVRGVNGLGTRLAQFHTDWLAETLNLTLGNKTAGIDIVGDGIGIEVKSRTLPPRSSWTIAEHQLHEYPEQYPGHALYWSFILADIVRTPALSRIRKRSSFEECLLARNAWIVPYATIAAIPVSPTCPDYRYVHKNAASSLADYVLASTRGGNVFVPKTEERLLERLAQSR